MSFKVISDNANALGGKAIRREIVAYFTADKKGPLMTILLYLPKNHTKPVPIFVSLGFDRNHSVNADTGITITQSWVTNTRISKRGSASSRWQVESLLERGYGVASIYCGDLDPDFNDGFKNGIHPLFYRPGQTRPDSNEWGDYRGMGLGTKQGRWIILKKIKMLMQ